MFYKNNWLSWSYDGVEFGPKTVPQSKFEFHIKKTIDQPLKSHKQELLQNAQFLRNQFAEPFDLMFSGGVDSEIILRCYAELKIPINVFVFKYENDYNVRDVIHALRICNELNVTPTVIDFNLEKFFENDAYDIWTKTYVKFAGRLPHMKMIDYLDNIPIMGDVDYHWIYHNNKHWKYAFTELDHSQSIYCKYINRVMLADWYGYSPELMLSFVQLDKMQQMFDLGLNANYYQYKYIVYKDLWPEIAVRSKRNGYEKFGKSRDHSPELGALHEFQKYIDSQLVSNHVCYFSETQLFDALCVQPSMPGYPATTH
jgi:hypothetical protein